MPGRLGIITCLYIMQREDRLTLNLIRIVIAVLCMVTGLWHQQTVGWEESKALLGTSFAFAFSHHSFYRVRIWNGK